MATATAAPAPERRQGRRPDATRTCGNGRDLNDAIREDAILNGDRTDNTNNEDIGTPLSDRQSETADGQNGDTNNTDGGGAVGGGGNAGGGGGEAMPEDAPRPPPPSRAAAATRPT